MGAAAAAAEFGKTEFEAELGVKVGSGVGVGVDVSLLCFKTSCEGCRFNLAKPREKLVKISDGEEDLAADSWSWSASVWSRSRKSP